MKPALPRSRGSRRGSILVIMLMIALGLVAMTLYFGETSVMAYRAADNACAGAESAQAAAGARRYLTSMLKTWITTKPGQMPRVDNNDYKAEDVAVGDDASFWLIGRDRDRATDAAATDTPTYGLVDEAAKLNLNTATPAMLEALLSTMTADVAAAIKDWRDEDDEVSENGAETADYQMLGNAYNAKNGRFESPEELRLVKGVTWALLYGEDANRNGLLDENENDGAASPPDDNQDGRLDFGLLEYVTVWSREPNKQSDGSARISVRNPGAQELRTLLTDKLGSEQRAQEIQNKVAQSAGNQPIRSVLEFYVRSEMKEDELSKVEDALTAFNDDYTTGLVNVNHAPEAVLACLPGIGTEHAPALVAWRQGKSEEELKSIAWVAQVLDRDTAIAAGRLLTTRSYQYSADIAALGHARRGLRRELDIIETADGDPRVIYHRDLTRQGWPLGRPLRDQLRSAASTRQEQNQ